MSRVFPSTPWVLVGELWLPSLKVSTFTHWAIYWPQTILLPEVVVIEPTWVGVGPLHTHCDCLDSVFVVLASVGVRVSFICFWNPFPPIGLLHSTLTREFMPSLIASCYVVFSCCPWKVCFFLKRNEGTEDLEERGSGCRGTKMSNRSERRCGCG